MILQKKQSLIPPAKYAAVHESRTAEDRRTAAELTARLAKLRNEHKDSAAHVASEISQPVVSIEDQAESGTVKLIKERRPWPDKVCWHTFVMFWNSTRFKPYWHSVLHSGLHVSHWHWHLQQKHWPRCCRECEGCRSPCCFVKVLCRQHLAALHAVTHLPHLPQLSCICNVVLAAGWFILTGASMLGICILLLCYTQPA